MEMNEILNGLNSCGCGDESSNCTPNCTPNCNTGGNAGFGGGCWIWILLILLYSRSGSRNKSHDDCYCCVKKKNNCCCEKEKNDCCCEHNESKGGCSFYLFLLVILFICNGNGSGRDCGNSGFGGLGGFGNLLGCC
ncbi:hypothetical protein [Clostridium gasigenes]|uniref:hypothetical protein n=1 Tax=Clostridium gasigenes TaxID=94869 RepID=UPI001C0BDDD5|nr:hypothetical protein [Clostridium gasigenes]MBU3108351.1 hypothetical protein [Clostridium gasigenes]